MCAKRAFSGFRCFQSVLVYSFQERLSCGFIFSTDCDGCVFVGSHTEILIFVFIGLDTLQSSNTVTALRGVF